MHEKFLYEYAVIRIVPKVEREEFINVGIIMFCKRQQYIKAKYVLDVERLKYFAPDLCTATIAEHLGFFEKICSGKTDGGVIGELDIAERFRWLTAVRSTIIQTSRPHTGFSENLEKTFERLFDELVL